MALMPARLARLIGDKVSDAETLVSNLDRKGRALVDNGRRAFSDLGQALDVNNAIYRQTLQAAARNAPRVGKESPPQPNATAPRNKSGVAHAPAPRSAMQKARSQLSAGLDGAMDAASMGMAERAIALHIATLRPGSGNMIEKYNKMREIQKAADEYEAEHYAAARNIGSVAGTVASIASTGGASAAPAGFVRIAPHAAKATGWSLKAAAQRLGPQAAIAATGAATSVGSQAATDLATGRPTSVADLIGATAGGASGALATLYAGPRAGAVAEAGVTETTRAVVAREPISLEAIERDAVAGAYLGSLGASAGVDWSSGLPWNKSARKRAKRWISKEELGDRMSEIKSVLRGEGVQKRQVYHKVSGGNTRADHNTRDGKPVEGKFGFGTELSKRQNEAKAELPDYRIDQFTPDDIGKALGGFLALIGGQAAGRPEDEPQTANR